MAQASLRNEGQIIVEDPIKFSLEVITLVKIATEICNDSEIRLLIQKKIERKESRDRLFCDLNLWNKIKVQIKKSFLKNSSIPASIKRKIFNTTRRIITEIIKWFAIHKELFYIGTIFDVREGFDTMKSLVWTAQGTLDENKTMLSIVNNRHVDLVDRYLIACTYCLEDLITDLQERMNLTQTAKVYLISSLRNPVIRIWVYNDIPFLEVLRWAYDNNTHALNFFFSLLQHTYHGVLIEVMKEFPFSPRIVRFSYFQQNTDNFSAFMIRKHPVNVLIYFLEWPNQANFYEAANQLMSFIDMENFHELFKYILYYKILQKFDDYNYRDIIIFLWNNCQENVKTFMAKKRVYPKLMYTIENDIVMNRELLVKEKMYNSILMTGYWIKFWLKRRDVYMYISSVLIISSAIILNWF